MTRNGCKMINSHSCVIYMHSEYRLLYKFEKDKKNGCVGSCGYAPASVKCLSKKTSRI